MNSDGDGDSSDAGRPSSNVKDAGKDARASSGGDDEDPTPVTRDAATGSTGGGTKDASTGSTSGGSKDASTGGSGAGAAIKCPAPLTCDTTLSMVLSVIDPTVKSGAALCANTGGFLPSAVTCKTTDECKSSRLTTATCSGGSCIQPCTP